MAKTFLATECPDQHGESIVGFPKVGRINLTGVARKDDLGAFADARENCFERGGFKVLCLVNNNDLVTRVPPRSFGYSHVGTFRYFDAKGAYHEDISWWRRFVDRVEGSIDDFLKLGPDAIRDHFMKGYLSNVARAAGL